MPNTEPVDVLIIGSGASGAAVAWSLADTKMRIVCLEQGDWQNPAKYPSTGRDWEARQFDDMATSPNRRQLPSDYPVNDDNSPIKVLNFNAVGGSTILYAAHYPRLHPSDFKVKSLDGVADDWPIDYRMLEPFFAENDRMTGVSGLAGDPAYPSQKTPPMEPLPMGRSGKILGDAMNRLGWHWWPSDCAVTTREYEGRAPCINLGHCIAGCAQGAKASTDITYWPSAIRAGVELRTNARVREITVDDKGMANGVIYYDKDDKEVFQPAHVVVVACNGVGTPRLLLNSKSAQHPNGLANSSGLVGKNLMFHPYASIYGYMEQETDGNRGPPLSLWSHQFYETDPSRGFVRGYSYQFGRGVGAILEAQQSMQVGRLPWGPDHHAVYRKLRNHRVSIAAICEDLPEEHNTVTLDPVLKDRHGIPAPKIDYTISENSHRMLDHAIARATEILKEAGAWEVGVERPIVNGGWHLLGTCRMGTDPATSVVNEWGRTHDVKNLFIVDGSVFVTSGGVNPTSTIQAIALYIADQMKQRLATLFDWRNPMSTTTATLTAAEQATMRLVAGMMIPASTEFKVPGADDDRIVADMVRSTGRDTAAIARAIAELEALSGGSFAALDPAAREAATTKWRANNSGDFQLLQRLVLQCYYRDDRVMISLNMEPRAPFPKGHELPQGDWSLLDPVRKREKIWRDA